MEEPDDNSNGHHWTEHTPNGPSDNTKNESCFCCYCRLRKEKESRAVLAARKQQRKADAIGVTLEKRGACSVYEEQGRSKRPPKKKDSISRPNCSRGFSRKTQTKEPKSEVVRTKHWDLVNVFQYPRIPHVQDTRPFKLKHRKEKRKKSCPCKPTDERKAGGSCRLSFTCCRSAKQESCTDTVRTKPTSILNVFQSPRISNLIEEKSKPSESCPCVQCSKNTKIEKPSQTKPPDVEFSAKQGSCRPSLSCFNRSREEPCSNPVHIKPESVLNMFQRPRVPTIIDGKQKPSVSEPSLFDPCDDKVKEDLTNPNPQPAECYTKNKSVLTKPTNVFNVIQRPRIPDVIEHSYERRKHDMECTCSICEDRSRCRSPAKIKDPIWQMWRPTCSSCFSKKSNTTKERTSQIVKTRLYDLANLFQHPRIPYSPSTRPVKAQPQESKSKESCQCKLERQRIWNYLPNMTCCKSSEKEPCTDVVCTTPRSILDVPQRSRVQNLPCPSHTDDAKSICSRISSQCLSTETVHTKPTNQFNIFQHPRLPNTTEVSWDKKKHSKECSCTTCEDRSRCKPPRKKIEPIWKPSWPKCMSTVCSLSKDPKSEFVRTKPRDLANVFQHPRVPPALDMRPAKVQPDKEQSKETCPCKPVKERSKGGSCLPSLSCGISTNQQPSTEFVRTKPSNWLNMVQRPRVPSAIGLWQSNGTSEHNIGKRCSCDICKERMVCETAYKRRKWTTSNANHGSCCRCIICEDKIQCGKKPEDLNDKEEYYPTPTTSPSSTREFNARHCNCPRCRDQRKPGD